MPKRFSGEVRMTVSKAFALSDDEYDIRLKAPGCSPYQGTVRLDAGYTALHGVEAATDEAAKRYLLFVSDDPMVKQAAKDGEQFHIGRTKADRWPGGKSNTKTKKGR